MSLNSNDNKTFTIGYLKEEYPERRCIYGVSENKLYAENNQNDYQKLEIKNKYIN